MTDFLEIAKFLSGAPLAVALLMVLWGGSKKVWAYGYQLTEKDETIKELRKERDEFKAWAFEAGGYAKVAVGIAKDTQK